MAPDAALSTAVMNHRALFVDESGNGAPQFRARARARLRRRVPDDAELRTISGQILASLDLDGAHGVTRRKDGAIVITRNDLLTPRRITYTPASHALVIERLPHRTNAMLERFHRRRG